MYDRRTVEPGQAPGAGRPEMGPAPLTGPQTFRKPRWRDAFVRLAGPALRLHRFRNLRTAMLYDALSRNRDGRKS